MHPRAVPASKTAARHPGEEDGDAPEDQVVVDGPAPRVRGGPRKLPNGTPVPTLNGIKLR